jgi:plastocyanin
MHAVRRLLVLLVLPVLIAACGGGGGGDGSASKQAASSKPCPQGTTVVHMKDIQFQPKDATVKVGDTVCWTNDDTVQHDAVADDGDFSSALFGKGQTFSWKAAKAGTVTYVCTVHPNMTATLVVKG